MLLTIGGGREIHLPRASDNCLAVEACPSCSSQVKSFGAGAGGGARRIESEARGHPPFAQTGSSTMCVAASDRNTNKLKSLIVGILS